MECYTRVYSVLSLISSVVAELFSYTVLICHSVLKYILAALLLGICYNYVPKRGCWRVIIYYFIFIAFVPKNWIWNFIIYYFIFIAFVPKNGIWNFIIYYFIFIAFVPKNDSCKVIIYFSIFLAFVPKNDTFSC